MFRIRLYSWTVSSIVLANLAVLPVRAQIPIPVNLNLPSPNLLNPDEQVTSGCIRVDGRCVVKVAAPRTEIRDRVEEIEQRLEEIGQTYFENEEAQLEVYTDNNDSDNIPEIYVKVGEQDPIRLMSVTNLDARLRYDNDIDQRANEIVDQLREGLREAKQERQPQFLIRQGKIAAGTGVAVIIVTWGLARWGQRIKRSKQQLASQDVRFDTNTGQPISTQIIQQQQSNLVEVKYRLLQLIQAGVVVGGSLFILGLFPYTRLIQVLILTSIRIPLRIGIVGLATYVGVRLGYAAIDWFTATLTNNRLLTPESHQRLQLRISTISGVTKSIVTLGCIGIGFIVALAVVGLDIGPLLAGAGIIGVGISLASQNLIKDFINGFFIILEDQYAIGDVIVVGDVGGFVENMNLRITQLRNEEGRLITIPNSEIRIVGNLSSKWSRADLFIPVAYQADVNKALALVDRVADQMSNDTTWCKQILEPPLLLGVDNFGEQGFVIRMWIKTQPLKQWDVSREFRRRLKEAFDEAGIALAVSRQEIWLNHSLPLPASRDGQGSPN